MIKQLQLLWVSAQESHHVIFQPLLGFGIYKWGYPQPLRITTSPLSSPQRAIMQHLVSPGGTGLCFPRQPSGALCSAVAPHWPESAPCGLIWIPHPLRHTCCSWCNLVKGCLLYMPSFTREMTILLPYATFFFRLKIPNCSLCDIVQTLGNLLALFGCLVVCLQPSPSQPLLHYLLQMSSSQFALDSPVTSVNQMVCSLPAKF